MHLKLNVKKIFLSLLTFFVASCLVILLIHLFYKAFPPETHKTEANVLLVEGSLISPGLNRVQEEFQNNSYEKIIITGLNSTDSYCMVSRNGYLVFYPHLKDTLQVSDDIHKIEVIAYSEWGGKERAHFNLYINNSQVSDYYASMRIKKYAARWKGKLGDIDSVMIQFDNDKYGKWQDINLYVKEIIIDNSIIIHYQYNSAYDMGPLDWKQRRVNNYSSNAEDTRNQLIKMGVDSTMVVAVPAAGTHINRTLRSVVTFRDWLKESGFPVKGINLISSGLHAKRKHMIYKKILAGNYDVGIICLPEYKRNNRLNRITNELREFFGSVYYWVVLRFY